MSFSYPLAALNAVVEILEKHTALLTSIEYAAHDTAAFLERHTTLLERIENATFDTMQSLTADKQPAPIPATEDREADVTEASTPRELFDAAKDFRQPTFGERYRAAQEQEKADRAADRKVRARAALQASLEELNERFPGYHFAGGFV